jgi:hypothetical protein
MKISLTNIKDHTRVTVTNLSWGDDDEGLTSLTISGTLEKAENEDETNFVRVKEDFDGVHGVSFPTNKIKEIERLPSGRIVIVLKF